MHLGHMHDCGTTAAMPKSAAMAALLGRPYIYEKGAQKNLRLSNDFALPTVAGPVAWGGGSDVPV